MTTEERIRKLLEISSSETATEAERENAFRHAVKLAQSIDSDIDQFSTRLAPEFLQHVVDNWMRIPVYATPVMEVVKVAAGVRYYYESGGDPCLLVAFGTRPHLEICQYFYTYLRREFLWRHRRRFAGLRRPPAQVSRGYWVTLAHGILERFETATAPSSQQAGLIVAREQQLDDAYAAIGVITRRMKADTRIDGRAEGRTIKLSHGLRSNAPQPKGHLR